MYRIEWETLRTITGICSIYPASRFRAVSHFYSIQQREWDSYFQYKRNIGYYVRTILGEGEQSMIIVTSYREIEQFPSPIIPYLRDRYRNIRKYFQSDILLEQHSLKEVGAFVLIENSEELNDLSQFHLYGGFEDQYIEFVKLIPNTKPAFYEAYIVIDTDSGINLIFSESILNIHQKYFIGGLMIRD